MTRNETERRAGTEPPPHVDSREDNSACETCQRLARRFRRRMDEATDAYGLGWLCFTAAMGLGSALAAVFITMLPLSTGWRYLWLCACLAAILLSAAGLILFFEPPTKGDLHHGHR